MKIRRFIKIRIKPTLKEEEICIIIKLIQKHNMDNN